MKTLVLYDSSSELTRTAASCLSETIQAEHVELAAVGSKCRIWQRMCSAVAASTHKERKILPLEEDIAGYERMIVVGPVVLGGISPVINSFLRSYQIQGKKACGVLTCTKDAGKAMGQLREELQNAGTECRNVIALKMEHDMLHGLKCGAIQFFFQEDGRLGLKASEPGREAGETLKRDVSEERIPDLIL